MSAEHIIELSLLILLALVVVVIFAIAWYKGMISTTNIRHPRKRRDKK